MARNFLTRHKLAFKTTNVKNAHRKYNAFQGFDPANDTLNILDGQDGQAYRLHGGWMKAV